MAKIRQGPIGGLIFWFLVLIRLVRLRGYSIRKFLLPKEGLIVYYRHPSLKEPALLPFLFFPLFLFNLRFVPLSTPDKRNYYQRRWFWFLRSACIPIARGNLKEETKALRQIKEELKRKKFLLIAPGGGRTFKGEDFKIIQDGRIEVVNLHSGASFGYLERKSKGGVIRRFKPGIAHILQNTQAAALPIWIETKAMRMTIVIGEPLRMPASLSRKEIIEISENTLLILGEK